MYTCHGRIIYCSERFLQLCCEIFQIIWEFKVEDKHSHRLNFCNEVIDFRAKSNTRDAPAPLCLFTSCSEPINQENGDKYSKKR